MKKCPNCQLVYDDAVDFCLNDGTRLTAISSGSYDVPTQVIQPRASAGVPPRGTSPLLYVTIGVLAAGFAAALIFIFLVPSRPDESKRSGPSNGSPAGEAPQSAVTPPSANSAGEIPAQLVDPTMSPGGSWTGDWTGKSAYFTAKMDLTETSGRIDGRIVWTLMRSSNPAKGYKTGTSAVEFVRGSFDPTTRLAKLAGYRKDDPNDIIILDRYDLSLSTDKQTLSGKSKNGNFVLRR